MDHYLSTVAPTGHDDFVIVAAVLAGSTLLGLTGLQVFDAPHHWSQATIEQFDLVAELMAKAVIRTRERGALAAADARARRIANFVPDGLLLVSPAGRGAPEPPAHAGGAPLQR